MEVEEGIVAEAAEHLLAAFYRSRRTGLRQETVDPLHINGEFDDFMRKISLKVQSLVQTVEDAELQMDRVCLSTSTTCRPQDLLIFNNTSAMVEGRQWNRVDQALPISSVEDAFDPDLNAQGPEFCFPFLTTMPTFDAQLEDIDNHQRTSSVHLRPQASEHNGRREASAKESSQVDSNPGLEETRKRRQSGIAPVPNSRCARKKLAVTSASAQSTRTCSSFGDLVEKLASSKVILQLREILDILPTSKISIELALSDLGVHDLYIRIIERDNVSRIQALAQCLDIYHLYQMFYHQISGQSSRAFEVLDPGSVLPGLSGNPLRRREKAVTERFIDTMLSKLTPVTSAVKKRCEDISRSGRRLYDLVEILGEPIIYLLVFAGAKEEHALDWRTNTYGHCRRSDEPDLADDRPGVCSSRIRFQEVLEEASGIYTFRLSSQCL
ncbi:hypothetical protein LTR56_026785 [Elasticomyces elasticus]|nr:hypothetical protein LTR56_026785 [Elasticomyces elasticus]KAK3618623.1 hypothetical protein LTR22_026307 [Elasticomyces elasticus]KAK4903597.1 hypothetical protein LTR49_026793 [Elasticomyces elasticus]KAK5737411.1 hypothetical protein LTS12_025897 [Elasticomyces elasticus]